MSETDRLAEARRGMRGAASRGPGGPGRAGVGLILPSSHSAVSSPTSSKVRALRQRADPRPTCREGRRRLARCGQRDRAARTAGRTRPWPQAAARIKLAEPSGPLGGQVVKELLKTGRNVPRARDQDVPHFRLPVPAVVVGQQRGGEQFLGPASFGGCHRRHWCGRGSRPRGPRPWCCGLGHATRSRAFPAFRPAQAPGPSPRPSRAARRRAPGPPPAAGPARQRGRSWFRSPSASA